MQEEGTPDNLTRVPFREILATYAMFCQEMRRRTPWQEPPTLTEFARDTFPALKKALDASPAGRPHLTIV